MIADTSQAKDIAPFSEDKTAGTRGIAYVGMYMSIMATLMWTWGYNYLIKSHAETGTRFDALTTGLTSQFIRRKRSQTQEVRRRCANV